MYARLSAFYLTMLLCIAIDAFAQGVQTGTIRGVVEDAQDLPVPGVTVTVTSPALQGARTAVTDATGAFTLAALPAGDYEVRYELSGFGTVTQKTRVEIGLTVEQNVTMRAAGVTETVQVVAETPAPIATPTVATNIRKEEIDFLPARRNIQGIATLAPSVTERSPNAGQLVINGAFAWDNVFMVNGVDVNDNLFASPQNLFIEDAIEETQVLTSGISAEYGRFSGGVINAITKSGGNRFSGSYRLNLLNPSWTEESPFEKERGTVNPDTLQNTHEGTFGGPIVRDRLWFFAAGRYGSVDSPVNLQESGAQLISNDLNKRGEIKLTGTAAVNHTIQGGYLNNPRKRTNNSGLQSFVIDPNSEVDRTNPNHYYFTNYRGVFGNMLVEAQYSQRKFKFQDDGGTSTNIFDSPFLALECLCVYNAPYFDATDPENRNNRQFTGNVTRYWDGGGRHDTKIGYEFYRSQRTGGNSQSSTSYVFNADFLRGADGRPAVDAQGRFVPVFVPGESYVEFYPTTRGAVMNLDNNSAFVQDHWVINSNLSADLGVRFEQVKATSTGDITSVNTSPRFVPRLGLSYDVAGTGNHVVHVTYGQYSGRYNEAQIGGNSPVGNPAYLPTYYAGPAGQGADFAPGFSVANYPVTPDNLAGPPEVPTANVFVDEDITSPLTHEFTTSYGITIGGGRGFAEATYVFRKTTNMIEDFTTRADGTTRVTLQGLDLGLVSNVVYRNTDLANREYQAMVFQTRYRIFNSLSLNGNYTIQLKHDGNYEGEGTNTPGSTSRIGDYPEAYNEDRYYPEGALQSFQRHKMRLWALYNLDAGRAGRVTLAGIWRVDSGLSYSLAVRNLAPSATQRAIVAAAGYPDLPGPSNVFFVPERGTEVFKGYGLFDWSTTYDIPVFKDLRPWLKFDVYNLFNNQKLIAWNTTITPDPSSPVDALGIRTGFIRSANFGRATGNTVTNLNSTAINAFPQWTGDSAEGTRNGGRTFRVALGVRF
jgi:outer membrane receptor protein involved in Fe transport